MRVPVGRRGALASIGLIAAATLWAVNMQLGEVLPYPACRHQAPYAGIASVVAIVLAAIAGWWSWRVYRRLNPSRPRPESDARRALLLLGGIGVGAAALFLFALALQAGAGFILTGCER